MEVTINQSAEKTFKKYIPIVTGICCLASLVLFIGIHLHGIPLDSDAYRKWGAPSVTNIFEGDYWGLITSNFLHVEIWHIAFNLYWFWKFGKKIELETNRTFYVFLILSSALVSSLAQLAFSGETGIGLSGIGYAFFGFLFVKSKTSKEYENFLEKRTINLFLFWLVLCVILTRIGAWQVGNSAHIGGLLWGALIAYLPKFERYLRWAIGSIYIAGLTILVFHSPFSTAYLSYQAYELHKDQKFDAAVQAYQQILKQDPGNEFAKKNLKGIQVYLLEQKAYQLDSAGRYNEARKVYSEILSIDRNNSWAKGNLDKLPSN